MPAGASTSYNLALATRTLRTNYGPLSDLGLTRSYGGPLSRSCRSIASPSMSGFGDDELSSLSSSLVDYASISFGSVS